MTLQNLKDNRDQIIAKYYELDGLETMLNEFMTTLKQAVEFGLNESEDTMELVQQFFSDRYKGKKEKTSIADVVSAHIQSKENEGKTWNPIKSRFEYKK